MNISPAIKLPNFLIIYVKCSYMPDRNEIFIEDEDSNSNFSILGEKVGSSDFYIIKYHYDSEFRVKYTNEFYDYEDNILLEGKFRLKLHLNESELPTELWLHLRNLFLFEIRYKSGVLEFSKYNPGKLNINIVGSRRTIVSEFPLAWLVNEFMDIRSRVIEKSHKHLSQWLEKHIMGQNEMFSQWKLIKSSVVPSPESILKSFNGEYNAYYRECFEYEFTNNNCSVSMLWSYYI